MSANVKVARPSRNNFANFDKILLSAVIALLFIGTLLVYAGTREWFRSNDLDPEYYLKRHVLNILIGSLLAYGTTLIDYRLLRAYTPIVWGAGVLGLLVVLVAGTTVNSAKAWIAFPGGFQLQPAELAKISIIVGMAMVLAERKDLRGDPTDSDVAKSLLVAAIPVGLILLQPDLGTVLIISAAVVAMIGASGAPIRWVVGL
jgi:rod shape determining protein RodA